MNRLILCVSSLMFLFCVSCSDQTGTMSDDGRTPSTFTGMWALVADYDSEYGYERYDKTDDIIEFGDGFIYYYGTDAPDYEGYPFSGGYFVCSRDNISNYPGEYDTYRVRGNTCYLTDYYAEDEYMKIKGGKLYWYYDDDCYEVYEYVRGFKYDKSSSSSSLSGTYKTITGIGGSDLLDAVEKVAFVGDRVVCFFVPGSVQYARYGRSVSSPYKITAGESGWKTIAFTSSLADFEEVYMAYPDDVYNIDVNFDYDILLSISSEWDDAIFYMKKI